MAQQSFGLLGFLFECDKCWEEHSPPLLERSTQWGFIIKISLRALLAGPSWKNSNLDLGKAWHRPTTCGWRIFPLPTGCILRHACPKPEFASALLTVWTYIFNFLLSLGNEVCIKSPMFVLVRLSLFTFENQKPKNYEVISINEDTTRMTTPLLLIGGAGTPWRRRRWPWRLSWSACHLSNTWSCPLTSR